MGMKSQSLLVKNTITKKEREYIEKKGKIN